MYKSNALRAPPLNRLLAALPRDEYRRLIPNLELVPLVFGEVIYKAGDLIRHVYFPTGGSSLCLRQLKRGPRSKSALWAGREWLAYPFLWE